MISVQAEGLRRLPVGGARARASVRGAVGQRWWIGAAIIVLGSLLFHSRLDPADRLAIRSGVGGADGSWYQNQILAGFAPSDFVVFAYAYFAAVHRFRRGGLRFGRNATLLTLAIAVCIAQGIATGIYHNTGSPFGDWRNIFVGALFAFALWSTVMTSDRASLRFAQLFVVMVAAYGAVQLAEYARGGGELAFYGRTTTGDHATLEYMVAAVGLSLALLRTRVTPLIWWAGIAIGTVMVLLAFRRYAWVELAAVFAFFPLFSTRNRMRYLKGAVVLALAAAVAIMLTWSSLQWSERLSSLDPTASKSTNTLAATNQGHLDDIRDGLDQVRAHPIFGLGAGIVYVGQRTVSWKGAGGMVHNAPVEVWIKFGILGVLTYAVVYLVLLRRLWRRRRSPYHADVVAWGAASFFLANLIISLTVYSWPFGDSERGILMFGLLAAAFPARTALQRSRESGIDPLPRSSA